MSFIAFLFINFSSNTNAQNRSKVYDEEPKISVDTFVSNEDITRLRKGELKSLSDFNNQTITAILLCDTPKPHANEQQTAEFSLFANQQLNVDKLLDEIVDKANGASFIQTKFFKKVSYEIKGDEIFGVIETGKKDLFDAKVKFFGERKNGRWDITKFSLPYRNIETSKKDNGLWRAKIIGSSK